MISRAYLDGLKVAIPLAVGRHHDVVAAAADRDRHDRAGPAPREARFVKNLLKNYRTLTNKPGAWLSAIETRLRGQRR
jgi:hypothetical protein